MKKLSLGTIGLALLLGSCDQYKEDSLPVINYSVAYHPNQAILFNLGAYINPGYGNSYSILKTPNSGSAEILKSSYLKFAPGANASDRVTVDIADADNNTIGRAQINFEANESACGIATFDHAVIAPDSVLTMDLANNDLLCQPIGTAILQVVFLENFEGLNIEIPRPDPIPQPTTIKLSYQAPAGFVGKVSAIYTAAINIKEEYADKWNSGENLLEHPEYFTYYVSSLVEIDVNIP
jgi:hypothetical protein